MEAVHSPVLPEEVLSFLAPEGFCGLFCDGTLGEGGHSALVLERRPGARVLGIDADAVILERAKERLAPFGERFRCIRGWSQEVFAAWPEGLERPCSILIDCGISLWHYEKSGRGFSFKHDEPLDMRLDAGTKKSAADLVSGLSEAELARVFFVNGGERYSRRIAAAIVQARKGGTVTSSAALATIVEGAVPAAARHGRVHPATHSFMALRIEVNGELARLRELLEGALEILKPHGRLGVISFHSGEDRIVKRFFRERAAESADSEKGGLAILTKKGLAPGAEECGRNPRSRSARLRVVEKGNE
jgi:16S rRNA (cytosine1402-N4)-methyltransferase